GRVELHVAGHGGRHVRGRDQAGAGEAPVDRGVLPGGGDAGLALRTEVDVALGPGLALAAVGGVGTDVEGRQPVAHALRRVEVGGQAEAAQLVVHVRDLAVAGAVDGVGQVQLGRVGVVHARGQLREAVAGEVQRHRVKLRGRQALQVVLQVG